jgi:WD40 repeat protein
MRKAANDLKSERNNQVIASGDKKTICSKTRSEYKSPNDQSLLAIANGSDVKCAPSATINAPLDLTITRTNHALFSDSEIYFSHPISPSGHQVDVSDRPILCLSSNGSREIVVGSADHALYSMDITQLKRKPVTMYTKTSGHTDWITGVAHLPNGCVLSSSMDGKLCLWDSTRRRCTDIFGHEGSITKVIADSRNNVALSLGYDGNILGWNFSSSSAPSGRHKNTEPAAIFSGHGSPVIDALFQDTFLASGGKDGRIILWDVTTGATLARFET